MKNLNWMAMLLSLLISTVSGTLFAQMTLVFDTELSAGTTITLPLYKTVNATVNWGDGSVDDVFTATAGCTGFPAAKNTTDQSCFGDFFPC